MELFRHVPVGNGGGMDHERQRQRHRETQRESPVSDRTDTIYSRGVGEGRERTAASTKRDAGRAFAVVHGWSCRFDEIKLVVGAGVRDFVSPAAEGGGQEADSVCSINTSDSSRSSPPRRTGLNISQPPSFDA